MIENNPRAEIALLQTLKSCRTRFKTMNLEKWIDAEDQISPIPDIGTDIKYGRTLRYYLPYSSQYTVFVHIVVVVSVKVVHISSAKTIDKR